MRVLAATHARIAIGSSILPKCIPTVRPFPALQRPITSSRCVKNQNTKNSNISLSHQGSVSTFQPFLWCRSGRQSVRVAAAIEFIEDEVSDGEGDVIYEDFQGVRLRDRGYTPFEFIEFTNIPLKHEVAVWVDRPVADCYKVWQNRLNWMQWFGMIDEVGFHEEQPSYISMYLWYRWGECWADGGRGGRNKLCEGGGAVLLQCN